MNFRKYVEFTHGFTDFLVAQTSMCFNLRDVLTFASLVTVDRNGVTAILGNTFMLNTFMFIYYSHIRVA